MTLFQIISVIIQGIGLLPKILSAFREVSRMSRRYRDGGLKNDLKVTVDIVGEVCRLAAEGDKALAKLNLIETKHRAMINDREGISNQRASLRKRRATFDPMDTVEKV